MGNVYIVSSLRFFLYLNFFAKRILLTYSGADHNWLSQFFRCRKVRIAGPKFRMAITLPSSITLGSSKTNGRCFLKVITSPDICVTRLLLTNIYFDLAS